MLGYVLTQGTMGRANSVGYWIPHDFGITLMRGRIHLPPSLPRCIAPGRLGGWGVRVWWSRQDGDPDLTLDGYSWKEGPSVVKHGWLPAAELGTVVRGPISGSFTYAFWEHEFRGQQDLSVFGSVTLAWRF
ncbi:MAG: DUF2219 family protein [Verrucomicrobiota bacterium]|nr:lipid A deacylase LpxR family protein [Limisphaera sp.]MDW8381999.1 DUF2219 family protein [Verrucomicrobiota bacterium]